MLVPIDVAVAGAYAIFLEHGTGEVTTALASPSGVFLVAAVEEEAAGLEEGEEDEHEYEDGTATATGLQWANALGASLVVSACRCGIANLFVGISCRQVLLWLCWCIQSSRYFKGDRYSS